MIGCSDLRRPSGSKEAQTVFPSDANEIGNIECRPSGLYFMLSLIRGVLLIILPMRLFIYLKRELLRDRRPAMFQIRAVRYIHALLLY